MSQERNFDPTLADDARIRRRGGEHLELRILHWPDAAMTACEFKCAGEFDPDVLDAIAGQLERHGIA
ncbi:hypothetical protein [Plantibacter sp. YIM 135249]|uniref:hypothetical protein n=1 Tax=Plantibacter sp. YIM 135249 TaxID=3423918 RepID=UPI003D3290CB